MKTNATIRCGERPEARRGAVVVWAALMMVPIFAFAAFSIDSGFIALTKHQLQNAADAAALAGALALHGQREDCRTDATEMARDVASINGARHAGLIRDEDIELGLWDSSTHTFTPAPGVVHAIRVTVRRSSGNGNPLPLFFAPVIGHNTADVAATAVAVTIGSPQFRFLIDDEMIDSDIESIEDLAASAAMSPDDLISDGDGDGYIDMPPGAVLELPTGQEGDEGMFDRNKYSEKFPFKKDSQYNMLDFLADGTALQELLGTKKLKEKSWNGSDAPHPDFVGKKVLDPVPGIDPMQSHEDILSLPDPDLIYVSPVSKSDTSMQERNPNKYGSPTAVCNGERRGLLAFRILSARPNPNGGSYLPLLTIEIVDPRIVDLQKMIDDEGRGAGKVMLVR